MSILNKNEILHLEKQERVNIGIAHHFYGMKNEFSNYIGMQPIFSIGIDFAGCFNPALMKNDGKNELGGILALINFL